MKKFLALLMAAAMLFSFAACGDDKKEDETTTETTTAESVAAGSEEESSDETTAEGKEEEVTEVVTEVVTDKSGETVTDKKGNAVTEKVTKKKTEKNTKKTEEKTSKKQTTPVKTEDPSKWSTAKVLEYYQSATAKVVSSKPGYTKTRSSTLNGYKAGAILTASKSLVLKFLGVGDENKFEAKVVKGTNTTDTKCGDFLKKSTLTTSDVNSAKAVKSGSNYVITISIKNGSSSISGGSNAKNNSPLDKCGICVGETDRSGYDHKTSIICYNALKDIASGMVMSEKTSNCKAVATVNAATGEISKLVVSWDASAEISKVYGSEATLSASTTVTYSGFGW